MNTTEQINSAVFNHITDVDTPEAFSESLTMMFDSFIDSDKADTAKLRIEVYGHYQNLKQFLHNLNKEILFR